MSISYSRASRLASSSPKEFDFQYFIYQNEGNYPMWSDCSRIFGWFYTLPENVVGNSVLALLALVCLIFKSMALNLDDVFDVFDIDIVNWIDLMYNSFYALHFVAHMYCDCYRIRRNEQEIKPMMIINYLVDVISFGHYLSHFIIEHEYAIKLLCYYMRMLRPCQFLSGLMEHRLKGDVVGILLKYLYFFTLIRVSFANIFVWTGSAADTPYDDAPEWLKRSPQMIKFNRAFYLVNNLFLGLGPETAPTGTLERLAVTALMICGTLFMQGITVASMALIMGIYIRPEETFRARFRIIMQDMTNTRIPEPLCRKVETFYRMYWHKQKAVSITHLMPLFPPTLKHAINTDIFFEALQKSRILCDLSYQFLAEIAKFMQIIHYVPGDIVIQRKSTKSVMVYISYGDVEMLTAEDDDTPILRFTRGSIMNPCGGCAEVASALSHVRIRAATFCTAHVLDARDLWQVTAKFGKTSGQAFILHSAFEEHFEKVKRHYATRTQQQAKHKSTILCMKNNLIQLKEARDREGELLLDRHDMFLEVAGCYVMRNHEDTSLRDDSDPICLRPTFPCILQPNSSLLICWNMVVACLTVVVVFLYPYNFFYLKTISMNFKLFNYFMDVVYVLDIMACLSTGTKIEEGIPVTLAHAASRQCTSFWFAVDLFSVLPLFYFVDDGRLAGLNKTLKMLKVFRLLKTFEDEFIYNSNNLRFISYVLVIVCYVYMVAAGNQYNNCFDQGKCDVASITFAPYWSTSELNDGPTETRLVYSWFFAISLVTFTSHKTSHYINKSFTGQLIVMMVLEISAVVYVLLEATFSATIMVTSRLRDQYKTCIDTVKNFLTKSNVDPVLLHRFIDYLKLCWFTDRAYSITHHKNSILFDLPPHVYQEIMAMQRNKYLLCIPCMKSLNKEVLKTLCASSRVFYTSPNEILQNTGEVINEIYVIRQGQCELINPVTRQVSNLIGTKGVFGDVECILRLPAFYTVRAVTHVQMVCISRKHVIKALNNPVIMNAIRFARQQPEYMQLQTRHSAFLKYEIAPHPPNREFFPLPRKHEPDTAFLLPFTRLGFFAVLRYIFPRFTIRPDGKYMQRYEWVRCTCAIISALMYPVFIPMKMQWPTFLPYLAWILDITAYFDIIQRMLVAYYDDKGILIFHPASTAAHYIKGAFIVDLISCLPLDYLDSVRTLMYAGYGGYMIPETIQYLMYFKLGQLYRVPNALDILNDYIERQDIILIIKILPIYLAFLMVLTSLILQSSVHIYALPNGGYKIDRTNARNWIALYSDFVDYQIDRDPWSLVLTCFYWVTYEMTTVGFGVLQATKMQQLYTLCIGALIASILTTFVAVTVLSIRANVNQALASYQGHIRDLKTFMKKEAIELDLQKEVLSYYEYKWDKTGGIDYRTMLKLCDQITLRTDTILHIYGQTFNKCPLLYKADMSLLRIIGRSVRGRYYRQNVTVVEREQVISELFIIDYGMVEMRQAEDDNFVVTKLPRGSIFGNLDNVGTAVSPNRFVTSANVHLLKINSCIFYKIIADFPSVKVLLLKFRPNDENFIIGSQRDQSVVASTWKERAQSSPMIIVSKDSMLKFLNVQSKGVQIYLILVSLFSVYADLFNATFMVNTKLCIGILYALDVLFVVKIVLNFALPLISDEESESRIALVSSRKSYLKGEFKYDILSLLPMELLTLLVDDAWEIFSTLRLNRLLKIVTVYNGLARYHQKLSINLTVTTISSAIVWFTLFIHTSSCIWYVLGTYHENYKTFSSWRYRNSCIDLEPTDHVKPPRPEANCTMLPLCHNHYLCSMYFIISAFTHNGVADILPKQQSEVVFVCTLMIVSTMMIMIYVGEFSNIIQYQSFRCFNFYSKYLELQDFLKANRVSKNLVEITKLYVLYLWRESRGYQIPKFLEDAPQCLRLKVMSAVYIDHLLWHPIFQNCEPAFLRHLAGVFKPFLYVENMWVVKDAEITNAMYFVHRGRVQELDEEMEKDLEAYEAGTFFGTPHGLTRDFPYTLSYKTVIKSQILTLTYDDWEFLLEHFPDSKNVIYKPAKKDDDDKDKKKKKLQITKAPEVRTIANKEDDMKRSRAFSRADFNKARAIDVPNKPVPRKSKQQLTDVESTSPWPLGRRKPSENLEKTQARNSQQKLTDVESTSPWPLGRRRSSDEEEKPKPKAKKPATYLEDDDAETSPWPLQNRRMSEGEPEGNEEEKLEKYPEIRSHFVKSASSNALNKQSEQKQPVDTKIEPKLKPLNKPPENPQLAPKESKSELRPKPSDEAPEQTVVDLESYMKKPAKTSKAFDEMDLYAPTKYRVSTDEDVKPGPESEPSKEEPKKQVQEHKPLKIEDKLDKPGLESEPSKEQPIKEVQELKPLKKEGEWDKTETTKGFLKEPSERLPLKDKPSQKKDEDHVELKELKPHTDSLERVEASDIAIKTETVPIIPQSLSDVDLKTSAVRPAEVRKHNQELLSSADETKATTSSSKYKEEEHPKLSKDDESEEEPPKPTYGRRKSTVLDVDRAATTKELESIKMSDDFSNKLPFEPTPKDIKTDKSHRSSAEEIELQKISYSRENLQKPNHKPVDKPDDRVFLPASKLSTASLLNLDVEAPTDNTEQKLESTTKKLIKSAAKTLTDHISRSVESIRSLQSPSTTDLKQKTTEQIGKVRKQETKLEKASERHLNLEPELFLGINQYEARNKQSMLSFNEQIRTLEISKDKFELQEDKKEVLDQSINKSMSAFIDDMEMKGSTAAGPSTRKAAPGGVRYREQSETFDIEAFARTERERDDREPSISRLVSSASVTSTASKSSPSMIDVEDFMFKEDKKKVSQKKSIKMRSAKLSIDEGKSSGRKRMEDRAESSDDEAGTREASGKSRRAKRRRWWWY